jgi:hypothetical protein
VAAVSDLCLAGGCCNPRGVRSYLDRKSYRQTASRGLGLKWGRASGPRSCWVQASRLGWGRPSFDNNCGYSE